jgi:ribonuclease R
VLGADGKVASIAYRERLESMKLIEECMVLANVAAAEALEQARTPLIYRIHDTPSKEKLFAFSDFLRTLNITFAKGQVVQPGTFNRILAGAKGTVHEAVMNDVVLSSQAQAIYDPANIGHFGLNLAKYAHFTSPIRRYADLIVHRALIRGLGLGEGGLTDREIKQLPEIAAAISMTERRAMAAERDSTDRYVAAYMEAHVGATFEARITGVIKFGLFVRLKESGAEGLLPARSLGADYFRHDERRQAMVGERSGTVYGLGNSITVKLMEAAPVTGGLRFELAEGGAPTRTHRSGKPGPGQAKERFQDKKTMNFSRLAVLLDRKRWLLHYPASRLFFWSLPWPNRPLPKFASTAKAERLFLCHPQEHPHHDREVLDQEVRSGAAQACRIQGRQDQVSTSLS